MCSSGLFCACLLEDGRAGPISVDFYRFYDFSASLGVELIGGISKQRRNSSP